jgi:hypothetical protein
MRWRDLDHPALAGIELWSFVTDSGEQLGGWRDLPPVLRSPERFAPGPHPENLIRYDAMCASRRVAAIGGLDAHQAGLRIAGRVPLRLMSYRRSFALLRTHLLLRSQLSGELDEDRAQVYDALRSGRAYMAWDAAAPARGFAFWATAPDGARLEMGEEAPAGDWRLEVRTPRPASLRLLRDGTKVAGADDGATLSFAASGAGVFRVEARLGGRAWILSNPIYLR